MNSEGLEAKCPEEQGHIHYMPEQRSPSDMGTNISCLQSEVLSVGNGRAGQQLLSSSWYPTFSVSCQCFLLPH